MPEVDVFVPPIEADWPPPGGGLIPLDLRQKTTTGLLRALGRVAPRFTPGLSMMLLHLAFLPDAAKSVDAVYEFRLSGPGGGVFTVAVNDGNCRISVGSADRDPDVIYEMEATTWLAMTQGRATGDEAVLLGKLRVRGDATLGRKFNELFAPSGEAAVKLAAEAAQSGSNGNGLAKKLVGRVLRRGRAA